MHQDTLGPVLLISPMQMRLETMANLQCEFLLACWSVCNASLCRNGGDNCYSSRATTFVAPRHCRLDSLLCRARPQREEQALGQPFVMKVCGRTFEVSSPQRNQGRVGVQWIPTWGSGTDHATSGKPPGTETLLMRRRGQEKRYMAISACKGIVSSS